MEKKCLFEKLNSCSEKDPLSHLSTEKISEQVNSMEMIFTLVWKNSKREATSKVSLLIESVWYLGIAIRGLF